MELIFLLFLFGVDGFIVLRHVLTFTIVYLQTKQQVIGIDPTEKIRNIISE